MNTNTMEMNLNEMATVTGGGDTMDHVGGAITGVTAGAMAGCLVGSIAGAPGAIVGTVVGASGCGVAGGVLGLKKVRSLIRQLFS